MSRHPAPILRLGEARLKRERRENERPGGEGGEAEKNSVPYSMLEREPGVQET